MKSAFSIRFRLYSCDVSGRNVHVRDTIRFAGSIELVRSNANINGGQQPPVRQPFAHTRAKAGSRNILELGKPPPQAARSDRVTPHIEGRINVSMMPQLRTR